MQSCSGYETLAWLKAVLCLFSVLFAGYWTSLFFRYPQQSEHPLHRIVAIFLWWRVFSDTVSLLLLTACPFSDNYAVVLKTAGEVVFALDSTLAYFVVLLVAWGFGVSRQHLYKQEVVQLFATLLFAFTSFLVYMIDPVSLLLVMMAIIGVLLGISIRITIDSMQRLEIMYATFRDHYWTRWLPIIEEKWELFGKFYYWELVYYASQMFSFAGLHVYLQLVEETALSLYISIDIFETVIESFSIFSICYLVRMRPPRHSLSIQWEPSDDWEVPLYLPIASDNIEDLGGGKIPVLVVMAESDRSGRHAKRFSLGVPESDSN